MYTPEKTAKNWRETRCMTAVRINSVFHFADQADPEWRSRYDAQRPTMNVDEMVENMKAKLEAEMEAKAAAEAKSREEVPDDILPEDDTAPDEEEDGATSKAKMEAEADEDEDDEDDEAAPAAAYHATGGVTRDDFYSYMPRHNYIYAPTREFWPGSSVNARLPKIPMLKKNGDPVLDENGKPKRDKPSDWLDKRRPIEQMTWAPGEPLTINNRLMAEGGWFERPGATTFNLFRPPITRQALDQRQPLGRAGATHLPGRCRPHHRYCAHRIQPPPRSTTGSCSAAQPASARTPYWSRSSSASGRGISRKSRHRTS